MRAYSALRSIDQIPLPPTAVQTLLLAAGTAQALSWPTSTGGNATNAGVAEAHIARVSFFSTVGVPLAGVVNMNSTNVALSSGTSVNQGSTGNAIPVVGSRELQIPRDSTGWSALCPAAAYCVVESWKM